MNAPGHTCVSYQQQNIYIFLSLPPIFTFSFAESKYISQRSDYCAT